MKPYLYIICILLLSKYKADDVFQTVTGVICSIIMIFLAIRDLIKLLSKTNETDNRRKY